MEGSIPAKEEKLCELVCFLVESHVHWRLTPSRRSQAQGSASTSLLSKLGPLKELGTPVWSQTIPDHCSSDGVQSRCIELRRACHWTCCVAWCRGTWKKGAVREWVDRRSISRARKILLSSMWTQPVIYPRRSIFQLHVLLAFHSIPAHRSRPCRPVRSVSVRGSSW